MADANDGDNVVLIYYNNDIMYGSFYSSLYSFISELPTYQKLFNGLCISASISKFNHMSILLFLLGSNDIYLLPNQ